MSTYPGYSDDSLGIGWTPWPAERWTAQSFAAKCFDVWGSRFTFERHLQGHGNDVY